MLIINTIDSLRLGLFVPVDRDTPIVEVLLGDEVMFDLSYRDDTKSQKVQVLFHDRVSGCLMDRDILSEILEQGVRRLESEVESV